MKKTTTAIAALLAALALAACGGGGGGETTGASRAAEATAPKPAGPGRDGSPQSEDGGGQRQGQDDQSQDGGQSQGGGAKQGSGAKGVPGDTSASFTPPAHHDSSTGAAPFEAKGGDNSIQEFGSEGSGSDFEAAATALHGYLDARAAGAWSAACSYMSPGVAASLAQLSSGGSGGGKASCPETLASLSAVPPAALREAAEAEVGALRTEGDRAFLLFRGAHGADYFMPMASEGGTWKVAAIAPSAIP